MPAICFVSCEKQDKADGERETEAKIGLLQGFIEDRLLEIPALRLSGERLAGELIFRDIFLIA